MAKDVSKGSRLTGRAWLAALAVALATALVYWPATSNGFIDLYDDGPYVLHNAKVRQGLTAESVVWSATGVQSHNWHPLTWLSHMADVQAYGLDPAGHHRTSVILHAANAGLVALLFAALGAPPLAAVTAAAVFGVHPLRLQSVAWISERKDVLSGLFALAALLAWTSFAQSGRRSRYWLCLVLFGLGLLSKPMLVTLPAVMLLLDLWPLRRVRLSRDRNERRGWIREVVDLAPFAALSAAVAIVTVAAQASTGSFATASDFTLGERLANVPTSILAYVSKTLWPTGLSIFYVHPRRALLSALPLLAWGGLLAATAGATVAWKRAPWVLVGWLWFVVMLLPVVGVLQVGRHAMADRYTYLPGIGLLLAATWTALAMVERFPSRGFRITAGAVVAAAIAALASATRGGIPDWKDSETVFAHAREVTGPNSVASNGLGTIAAGRGRFAEAERLFRESMDSDPAFGIPRQNLAALLLSQDRVDEAWAVVWEAIRVDPANGRSYYVAGLMLERQGRLPEAAAAYEETLRRIPDHAGASSRLVEVRQAIDLHPAAPGGPRP